VAYDSDSNRLILFGGSPTLGGGLNDLWVLVGADGTEGTPQWLQLATINTPAPRKAHAAAYDAANNRLIVYGGCLGLCTPIDDGVYVLSNANGLGGTPIWEKLNPGGPAPPVRNGHTAVYDPSSNRLIVHGGANCCGGRFADTWVLTNANGLGGPPAWEPLFPASLPPVRVGHSAVYDPSSNRMIVMGGASGGSFAGGYLDDVWVLANANGLGGQPEWTQLAPGGTPPASRAQHAAVYDAATNRMIVFGGSRTSSGGNAEFLDDVWILNNANGLGGPQAWSRSSASAGPSARTGAHAVYHPSTQRLVVFGGANLISPLVDTWVLAGATENGPPPQLPTPMPRATPLPAPPLLRPGDVIVVDTSAFGGTGGIIRVDPVTGAQAPISGGGNFVKPSGVVVAPSGDIYVADVDAFGGSGGVIRVDPRTGAQTPISAGGRFVEPFGIALSPEGDLLVADAASFGDNTGAIIRVDPSTGAQTEISWGGRFVDPVAVATGANGTVFVADFNAPEAGGVFRIDVATGAQTPLAGAEPLQPTGIAVGPHGEILVADSFERTSACLIGCGGVFRIDPVTGARSRVSTGGNFARPRALVVDASGLILVVDGLALGGGAVIRVDPVSGAQAPLASGGYFVSPTGIAIVPDARLLPGGPPATSTGPQAPGSAALLPVGVGFALRADLPTLTWAATPASSGPRIARWSAEGLTILPRGDAPLPPDATTFRDESAPADLARCYAVFSATEGTVTDLSDVLCLIPSSAPSAEAPGQFSLQSRGPGAASLTWGGPPWQTAFRLDVLSLDASVVRTQMLVNAERATVDELADTPTCYRLEVLSGSDVLGTTDLLCIIPTGAILTASRGAIQSLRDADPIVMQVLGAAERLRLTSR
jgi:sugar lactone lactonase YvrE